MDNDSKDAEIRARVTRDIYDRLAAIAASRGEQLPTIAREAFAEYLAKRIGSTSGRSDRETVLDALRDKPSVVQALLDLAQAVKPATSITYPKASKKDTQHKILNIVKKKAGEVNSQKSPPK